MTCLHDNGNPRPIIFKDVGAMASLHFDRDVHDQGFWK